MHRYTRSGKRRELTLEKCANLSLAKAGEQAERNYLQLRRSGRRAQACRAGRHPHRQKAVQRLVPRPGEAPHPLTSRSGSSRRDRSLHPASHAG
ncbi:hypothetical protein [Halomonas sp. DP8Y7-1]|uniref:hypothetical protein n=1 Tax=Halomonas sp. DP8Y7-1 TaxID=2859078 RepID=UPI00396561E9